MEYTGRHEDRRAPQGNNSWNDRFDSRGADLSTVRAFNRRQILNYLRKNGSSVNAPTPRVLMAKQLGLSRATISSIIDELLEEGLVIEGAKLRSTKKGGKRATNVLFNAKAAYIVGIDISRSRYRVYLANLDAMLLDQYAILLRWKKVHKPVYRL